MAPAMARARRAWGCAIGFAIASSLLAGARTRSETQAPKRSSADCRFDESKPTPAQKRWTDLGYAITALADHDDARPVVEQLRGLLDEPCFRFLKNTAPMPDFGSAVALKVWWRQGGDIWIRSAILPSAGQITLPPVARKVLALEGNEGHPFASLLCRAKDPVCGRETTGWMQRAEDLLGAPRIYEELFPESYGRGAQEKRVQSCALLQGESPAAQYVAWRACIEKARSVRDYLPPLGRFRPPTQGWLVVRGRRGHYNYCDELAAYDLATGAAFRARRCGDIGIGPPVDAEAADRRRTGKAKVTVERGRLPVDNLREAVLLVFLWREIQRNVADHSDTVTLPPGIALAPLPQGILVPRPPSDIRSSADTTLSWEWFQGGSLRASNKLVHGPRSGRGYPAWLLWVAEEGLLPGCPPAPLPAGLLGRGAPIGGVAFIDASREQLDAAETALARALTEQGTAPCAVTP
jgi:hypothetical protein